MFKPLLTGLGFLLLKPLAAAPAPTPIVYVTVAKQVSISDTLTYPAQLVTQVNANVLSESDGVVTKLVAKLGSSVRKGKTVMVVQHSDPLYDYAPVRVAAPVNGIISQIEVSEGSRVTRGQKLATIIDPQRVAIRIEVAIADLPQMKQGMVGQLSFSGDENPRKIRLRGISPFPDPATGTAAAELEWLTPNQSTAIPPGLVATATFQTPGHAGFQLAENAVVYRGGNPFVRIVETGKAKYQAVKTGRTRRGLVEISSGLQAGMQVIVRTSTYVAEGDTVTVEQEKAEGAVSE